MEPTQYPAPVNSGGLWNDIGAEWPFTLRNYLLSVRQPGLGNAPNVVSLSGFGSPGLVGPGATISGTGNDADQTDGLVKIFVGLAPAGSGTIVLRFPIAPGAGTYVLFADWANALGNGTPAGNNLTINWTANRTLIANEVLMLAYQWAVSL